MSRCHLIERVRTWSIICLLTSLATAPAMACPFCAKLGKTLSEEAAQAQFVAAGTLHDPALSETGFTIFAVIKQSDPPISGQATLMKYLASARNEQRRVIFADVVNGKLDPFRIMAIRSEDFVPYLHGAVQKASAPPAERLAYFFQYLEHSDTNIAVDAYQEFAKSPYREVVQAQAAYDPDRLIAMIRNPATPGDRLGLYGLLLGVVGRPEDRSVVRELATDPDQRRLNGVDGLLGGYCVMDPQQGPEFALDLLGDASLGFNLRYAALEAIRFALAELEIDREQVFARLTDTLAIPELSDLVVDELRKYQRWSALEEVLKLQGKPEYDLPVVHRAVLRFMVECPDPQAKAYVDKIASENPRLLAEVKESLEFEKRLIQQFGSQRLKDATTK